MSVVSGFKVLAVTTGLKSMESFSHFKVWRALSHTFKCCALNDCSSKAAKTTESKCPKSSCQHSLVQFVITWLKQTFTEADKNGDGSLSISEVLQLLHKLNVNLPRQKVKQMFKVQLHWFEVACKIQTIMVRCFLYCESTLSYISCSKGKHVVLQSCVFPVEYIAHPVDKESYILIGS